MNRSTFLEYVEKIRDCDPALLDNAINKGIIRARRERPDYRRIFCLGASALVTAAMCAAIAMTPISANIKASPLQAGAEILVDYARDALENAVILLTEVN